MLRRDKLKKTLNHEQGPLCVDFGSTAVTGIHVICVEKLREHFGLKKKPVKVHEPYQMLGMLEDDLLEALDIDTIGVNPPETLFGFPLENWKEFQMPWGQNCLVPERFNTTKDSNEDLLIYPKGDTSAPPSGRMPTGGYFFDTIIRQPEIVEEKLDPQDNLEEFDIIEEKDIKYFTEQIEQAYQTERGVVATFGGLAFGDIALVPAPFLKHPKGIRDITEWYISTASRRDYIHKIFEKQCEIGLKNLERIYKAVGNKVDVVFICGTDFGTQTSQFCSVDTYNELYAPYYKAVNNWIHKNTEWKTFKHSCGAVFPLMKQFIESGFDIINPVQFSATDMGSERLKEEFGKDLVFWGGGVDTQKTLPFGTPDDVYKEVTEQCRLFSDNGGFVFNTVHNVQATTPIENIVAMFKALNDIKKNK